MGTGKSKGAEKEMNASKFGVLVLCGPSGVGKGTLIKLLKDAHPSTFGFSVSHTTRASRDGEEDGVHYHFTNCATFESLVSKGNFFVESAKVHGNFYGTSFDGVEKVIRNGKQCILDIDIQGAQQVKKSKLDKDSMYVFVNPPSLEELEKRLRGRGSETDETLLVRLANAQKEMDFVKENEGFFDHTLLNDELKACYKELEKILGLVN